MSADVIVDLLGTVNPVPHLDRVDIDDATLLGAIDRSTNTMSIQAERRATRRLPDLEGPGSRPWRRPLLVAAASFIVVLLTVALAGILLRETAEPTRPVATTPPPVTTSLATTSIPPGTEAPSAGESLNVETSFGPLTWIRIDGTSDTIPVPRLLAEPDGGFGVFEGASSAPSGQGPGRSIAWSSGDAMTWEATEIPELNDFDFVQFPVPGFDFVSGWAVGFSDQGPTLLRQTEHGWEPVELPEAQLPEVEGLVWDSQVAMPIESGNVTLALSTARGRVPWEDYYGTRDWNGVEGPNFPEIDEENQALRFFDNNGAPLATLVATRDGNDVAFVDVDSDEVVHEVAFVSGFTDDMITQVAQEEQVEVRGMWTSRGDGRFEFNLAPWSDFGHSLAVPDGGFAYYVRHDEVGVLIPEVWTSEDGTTWIEHESPSFLAGQSAPDVLIRRTAQTIRADVGPFESVAVWESTDGVTWRLDTSLPGDARVYETGFGFVATAMLEDEELGLRYFFWVSTDGDSWDPVAAPPGRHEPDGGGSSWAGGAGDVLYLGVTEDSGSRFLWIGRIEP